MAKAKEKSELSEKIEVPVNDKAMTFTVTPDDIIHHTDEVMPDNKYDPAFNFLMATVDQEHKERLRDLVKNPMDTMALFGEVYQLCGSNSKIGSAVKK